MKVLEIGCGDGTLWKENKDKLPETYRDYIVRYHRKECFGMPDVDVGIERPYGSGFQAFDCHRIPYEDQSFDLVVAGPCVVLL